jgi:hypothetical protein
MSLEIDLIAEHRDEALIMMRRAPAMDGERLTPKIAIPSEDSGSGL